MRPARKHRRGCRDLDARTGPGSAVPGVLEAEMRDQIRLKDCPFCGGPAMAENLRDRGQGYNWYSVGCRYDECPVRPSAVHPDIMTAAEMWNQRGGTT